MKKSTKIIVGSALIALALQGNVLAKTITTLYGPIPPDETSEDVNGYQDPDNINWNRVAEDVYGDSSIIKSVTIRKSQLNRVLRIHNMNQENWFSFVAPQTGMLRFYVDPSSIDLDYFRITTYVDSEDRWTDFEEHLVRKDGGIQVFTSPVVNGGDRICWYNQDIINNNQMYEPYLLYLEFIPATN